MFKQNKEAPRRWQIDVEIENVTLNCQIFNSKQPSSEIEQLLPVKRFLALRHHLPLKFSLTYPLSPQLKEINAWPEMKNRNEQLPQPPDVVNFPEGAL